MNIRSLEVADAADFQALRLRGLIECPSAFASSYEEERELSLQDIGQRLQPMAGQVTLGAFDAARLVGMLGLVREDHMKLAHKGFLWGMYVAPEYRTRGIGRELVSQTLARARKMPGVRQIYLGVNAANQPALGLYQSMGFQAYGREPGFMLLDGILHDEILMVCFLEDD